VKFWFGFGNLPEIIQCQMFKILSLIGLICLQINSFSFSILPEFSAVYNSRKKAVVVKWQHLSPGVKSYVLQRSKDNKTWTDIAVQQIDAAAETRSFYFEDRNFATGENYYHLKYIYTDGNTTSGQNVIVIIGSATNSWVMYPVPVTNLLTLEYRGSEAIRGVINVIIQQPTGKIFTKLRYASLSRQIKIPVDNLPKGIYDIRILVQDEVIWDQRFLK
jgi:hypothetical protein